MTRSPVYLWTTAFLLWVGVVGATGVIPQKQLSLDLPLDEVVHRYTGLRVMMPGRSKVG